MKDYGKLYSLKDVSLIRSDQFIRDYVHDVSRRIKMKFDEFLVLSGDEGDGKSTLALTIAFLYEALFNRLLDLRENVVHTGSREEIKEKHGKSSGKAFVIDEGIKSMYKLQWMEKEHQKLTQYYATKRYLGVFTILCIPRFKDLSENFRNHRVHRHIHVLKRGTKREPGYAIMCTKDKDKDIADPWHTKFNIKIKEKSRKKWGTVNPDIEDKLIVEKKLPNYIASFRFGALPERIENAYDFIRKEMNEKERLKELLPQKEKPKKQQIEVPIQTKRAILPEF